MDDIKLFAENEKYLGTLRQAASIYSQDIEVEFSIEKCAVIIMKIEKRLKKTEGIELPNQEKIWTLGEKKAY